jgi:2-oxoacid:acceptor oxidoreductase delta subunit (pyruvate/2-ketoisovalerate family)
VFAGGDVIDEPHTVAFAIGSGKRAAIGIDQYLRMLSGEAGGEVEIGTLRLGPDGNVSVTRWRDDDPVTRVAPENEVVKPADLNLEHFARVPRIEDRMRPPWETRHDFGEANLGLARDAALAEAGRCFNCGVCNGCEVCLVFCPDVAISRRSDGRFDIDYDHCKGCGVCAEECPRGAIGMTREGL